MRTTPRLLSLVRLGLGLGLLSGCITSTDMARSSASTPARRLYADGEVDEGELALERESEERPAPVDAVEVPRPTVSGSAGGAVEDEGRYGAPATESPPPSELRSYEPASMDMESVATSESGSGSDSYSGALPAYTPPNFGSSVVVEPLPWVPLDPAPVPAGPRRVLLATMEMPPGRTIFPPVSACQDVLVYVQAGTLEAMGTGVGTTDAPATLYPGDAARFGAEGDGRLVNRSGEPASALIVIARARDAGAPLYTSPVDVGLCTMTASADPLVRTMRLASVSTATPLVVNDGHLSVHILLDLEGNAAEHAGLAVLEGDAEMRVAAHVHDAADEILFIEEGAGDLRVGAEHVAIGPGVVLYIPEGVEHEFTSAGTSPFRAVQLYAPSGPEQRFRGLAGSP